MEKRSDTFVKKFSGRFLAWFKQNIGILIGLAALMAIVSLFSESFFTASNMWNILRQISTNALLAFGMTFVILIGGIDLSVGPLLAFSGVFAAYVMGNLGWPIWAAIAGSIILCSMVGMLNGVIVTKTGIAPFVVTLSVQQIFRGFAMLLANGAPIRIRDQGFINIGTTYIGPVAFPVIYMIIIMALCYVVLNKTQFGRHIYALGGNKTAARFAGIRTQRIEVMVYALSGFLAGIAGIVLAARMTAGVPATGDGYECDAIAAVVLGGASFTGGIGTIGGTLIGAIIIGVLNVDRTRDLTPTASAAGRDGRIAPDATPQGGGSETFSRFLTEELRSVIDSTCRTNGKNMLIGHSYAGLFTLNTFLRHTELFDTYLAVDPSLWWDQGSLSQEAAAWVEGKDFTGKSLYIGVASKKRTDRVDIHLNKVNHLLTEVLPQAKNLRFFHKSFPEENHGTVAIPGIYDGIKQLFGK